MVTKRSIRLTIEGFQAAAQLVTPGSRLATWLAIAVEEYREWMAGGMKPGEFCARIPAVADSLLSVAPLAEVEAMATKERESFEQWRGGYGWAQG